MPSEYKEWINPITHQMYFDEEAIRARNAFMRQVSDANRQAATDQFNATIGQTGFIGQGANYLTPIMPSEYSGGLGLAIGGGDSTRANQYANQAARRARVYDTPQTRQATNYYQSQRPQMVANAMAFREAMRGADLPEMSRMTTASQDRMSRQERLAQREAQSQAAQGGNVPQAPQEFQPNDLVSIIAQLQQQQQQRTAQTDSDLAAVLERLSGGSQTPQTSQEETSPPETMEAPSQPVPRDQGPPQPVDVAERSRQLRAEIEARQNQGPQTFNGIDLSRLSPSGSTSTPMQGRSSFVPTDEQYEAARQAMQPALERMTVDGFGNPIGPQPPPMDDQAAQYMTGGFLYVPDEATPGDEAQPPGDPEQYGGDVGWVDENGNVRFDRPAGGGGNTNSGGPQPTGGLMGYDNGAGLSLDDLIGILGYGNGPMTNMPPPTTDNLPEQTAYQPVPLANQPMASYDPSEYVYQMTPEQQRQLIDERLRQQNQTPQQPSSTVDSTLQEQVSEKQRQEGWRQQMEQLTQRNREAGVYPEWYPDDWVEGDPVDEFRWMQEYQAAQAAQADAEAQAAGLPWTYDPAAEEPADAAGGGGQNSGGGLYPQYPPNQSPPTNYTPGAPTGGEASPGGTSLSGDLSGSFQEAYDEARAANEARYQEILGGYGDLRDRLLTGLGQYGDSQRMDINAQYGGLVGSAEQDLISRGLGNTTVRPSVLRGIEYDRTRAMGDLEDRLMMQRLGVDQSISQGLLDFMERRNDAYPDFNQLLELQRQLGASGQGAGGPGGGGQSGGGGVQGAGGQTVVPPQQQQQQQQGGGGQQQQPQTISEYYGQQQQNAGVNSAEALQQRIPGAKWPEYESPPWNPNVGGQQPQQQQQQIPGGKWPEYESPPWNPNVGGQQPQGGQKQQGNMTWTPGWNPNAATGNQQMQQQGGGFISQNMSALPAHVQQAYRNRPNANR